MAKKTQCPHCMSVFQVTAEQLAAREGKVRCGRCFQVFQAANNLVAVEPEVTVSSTATPPQQAPVSAAVSQAMSVTSPDRPIVRADLVAPVSPPTPFAPTTVLPSLAPPASPEFGVYANSPVMQPPAAIDDAESVNSPLPLPHMPARGRPGQVAPLSLDALNEVIEQIDGIATNAASATDAAGQSLDMPPTAHDAPTDTPLVEANTDSEVHQSTLDEISDHAVPPAAHREPPRTTLESQPADAIAESAEFQKVPPSSTSADVDPIELIDSDTLIHDDMALPSADGLKADLELVQPSTGSEIDASVEQIIIRAPAPAATPPSSFDQKAMNPKLTLEPDEDFLKGIDKPMIPPAQKQGIVTADDAWAENLLEEEIKAQKPTLGSIDPELDERLNGELATTSRAGDVSSASLKAYQAQTSTDLKAVNIPIRSAPSPTPRSVRALPAGAMHNTETALPALPSKGATTTEDDLLSYLSRNGAPVPPVAPQELRRTTAPVIKPTSRFKQLPVLWTSLAILMALLLPLQYLFFHLNDMMASGFWRPIATPFCNMVQCQAARMDASSLTVGAIEARHHPTNRRLTRVSALLANRGTQRQPMPLLDMKVDGGRLGRVMPPSEYLNNLNSTWIEPNTTVKLTFDVQLPLKQAETIILTAHYL